LGLPRSFSIFSIVRSSQETLIKAYLMVWNALVENRVEFMEQNL